MNEDDENYREDVLINIKLPRAQYEILKNMIEREQAYNWFTNTLKSSWLWIVGGGVLTFILLYDRINLGLFK